MFDSILARSAQGIICNYGCNSYIRVSICYHRYYEAVLYSQEPQMTPEQAMIQQQMMQQAMQGGGQNAPTMAQALEYKKMQDYFDSEFWDVVYNEYGVTDELDILSENVTRCLPGFWNCYFNYGIL